jgi:hypothetical protein
MQNSEARSNSLLNPSLRTVESLPRKAGGGLLFGT